MVQIPTYTSNKMEDKYGIFKHGLRPVQESTYIVTYCINGESVVV